MRLNVNLIPAIAYALVTMFSNMAGLTTEHSKSPNKVYAISCPAAHQQPTSLKSYVVVAKNGAVILSNGIGNANLVWKIPYIQDTKL